MSIHVENAIILAAGFATRFVPFSLEFPKGLTVVKGEVLIERQIRQLQEAGIMEIIIVTGYKKEKFDYLREKFSVTLVENFDYAARNNHSSIYAARNYLKNTYICSSDNYFSQNPFQSREEDSFYSGVFADGPTEEWCITTDEHQLIADVSIGGHNSWYMLGHVFWSRSYSEQFLSLLEKEYYSPDITNDLWEHIYLRHIEALPMYLKTYPDKIIYEFDSLEELRQFDVNCDAQNPTKAFQFITNQLSCLSKDICNLKPINGESNKPGFSFTYGDLSYLYQEYTLTKIF